MPLDDAIGGRAGRATLGKYAARLRRRDIQGGAARAGDRRDAAFVSASAVITLAVAADFLVLAASGAAVAVGCGPKGVLPGAWILAGLVSAGAALALQRGFAVYSLPVMRQLRTRLGRMAVAYGVAGAAGAACLALLAPGTRAWPLWLVLWPAVSVAGGAVAAIVTWGLVRRLDETGALARRVAVAGTGAGVADIVRILWAEPRETIAYVGQFDEGDVPAGRVFQGTDLPVDGVVLCVELDEPERIARLRAQLRPLNCDIYLAGPALEQAWAGGALRRLGDLRVALIERRPLDDWQKIQKAVLDRVGAAILLVALAPVFLVIALAIGLDSKGAVLFRQPRTGLNNRIFTMFKFRTMYRHQTDLHGGVQATRRDPRVTRVGRFLRRTSLDELPQLLNVLAGDMSLVGPRPHAAATRAGGRLFQDVVADYPLRHRVKPGMTGWAQVNGWRGETATADQIEQRVAHDLHYIDHWSLLFDLRILVLTLVHELNSKTAF